MCLIIDTNVAALILTEQTNAEFAQLHRELFRKQTRVVVDYGGSQLLQEMQRNANVWRLLLALDQAGRARAFRTELVDAEQAVVDALPQRRSDDPHVLALARVSGARLLATKDGDLITDFKNSSIVNSPRGKVYTRNAHERLVRAMCC